MTKHIVGKVLDLKFHIGDCFVIEVIFGQKFIALLQENVLNIIQFL